jgi:hypothetical protein
MAVAFPAIHPAQSRTGTRLPFEFQAVDVDGEVTSCSSPGCSVGGRPEEEKEIRRAALSKGESVSQLLRETALNGSLLMLV